MKTKKLFVMVVLLILLLMGACGGINEPAGTDLYSPVVSPDNKFIAYYCSPLNGDKTTQGIYIMSIEGDSENLIYPLDYGLTLNRISWSPSGRQLLIQAGIITLEDNRFKGMSPNKILKNNNSAVNFSWAPDGNSILYNINDSVYVCDTLFQHSRKLPLQGKGASWMPDGERISYIKNEEIYTADTLNLQKIQITNDGEPKSAPIPSPDGTKFVYMLSSGNIWLIDADGSNHRFLTKANREGYSWTSDSKSIIYSKTLDGWGNSIWRIDIDGKNDLQISE